MDNKSEDKVLIIQASQDNLTSEITAMNYDTNKRDSDMKKIDYDKNKIKTIFTHIINQKHNYFPDKRYSPKSQYPTIAVPSNKKAPP